jgi:large subunit ribosomal protein L15
MRLNEIRDNEGARKARIRVGRGSGSGKGGTAGRGDKGQKARSGVSLLGFEGGQMPLYRRMPKRGFKNIFAKKYEVVNLGQLQKAIDENKLDGKGIVNAEAMKAAGLVRNAGDGVRLLAKGDIKAGLTVEVTGASKAAVAAVEQAGGSVVVPERAPEKEKKIRGKWARKRAGGGDAAESAEAQAADRDDKAESAAAEDGDD